MLSDTECYVGTTITKKAREDYGLGVGNVTNIKRGDVISVRECWLKVTKYGVQNSFGGRLTLSVNKISTWIQGDGGLEESSSVDVGQISKIQDLTRKFLDLPQPSEDVDRPQRRSKNPIADGPELMIEKGVNLAPPVLGRKSSSKWDASSEIAYRSSSLSKYRVVDLDVLSEAPSSQVDGPYSHYYSSRAAPSSMSKDPRTATLKVPKDQREILEQHTCTSMAP